MAIFTLVHVLLSLAAIVAGVVVVVGLLSRRVVDGWTVTFLATMVATDLTGFGFPFTHFLPSHGVGILSLMVLALASVARRFPLSGAWSRVFAVSAVTALYFDVFVLVVQAFLKVPALAALAPTQSEPPFAVTQLCVLALFVLLGIAAVRATRPASAQHGVAMSP
jgi:hypothetical protein